MTRLFQSVSSWRGQSEALINPFLKSNAAMHKQKKRYLEETNVWSKLPIKTVRKLKTLCRVTGVATVMETKQSWSVLGAKWYRIFYCVYCAHKLTYLLTLKVNHYRIVALSFWKRQLLSKISLFITYITLSKIHFPSVIIFTKGVQLLLDL